MPSCLLKFQAGVPGSKNCDSQFPIPPKQLQLKTLKTLPSLPNKSVPGVCSVQGVDMAGKKNKNKNIQAMESICNCPNSPLNFPFHLDTKRAAGMLFP